MTPDDGVAAPVNRPPHRPASASKALTITLLAAMLVVHNAQRTAVVPLLTDLQPRFGVDYAGVGTLFAAYVGPVLRKIRYRSYSERVRFLGDGEDAVTAAAPTA